MQTLNELPRAVVVRAGLKPIRAKGPSRPTDPSGNHDRGSWRGAHRKKWHQDPTEMLTRDSVVRALLAEVKGVRLGKQTVSASDIDELLAYLVDVSWQRQRKYRRRRR